MYNKPELFRNAYYFLKKTSLSSNMYEAVLFTKTPPEGVTPPVGVKEVGCREEMFGDGSCNHKKETSSRYVVYIDPSLNAKEMINLFHERVEQHIAIGTPKGVQKATVGLNPPFPCDGEYDSNDMSRESSTLESLIESSESMFHMFGAYRPNLTLLRQNIKFKLYDKLREVELSPDSGIPENDEKRKRIERMIERVERDQLPKSAYFSKFDGVLKVRLNERELYGLDDDFLVIELPEIYLPPDDE